jgi:hypothetical protein
MPPAATWFRRASLAFALLACVTACTREAATAPGQAQRFVEALVLDPGNHERLTNEAGLATGADTAALVQGQAADVALQYLRVRQRMGATLRFSATLRKASAPDAPEVEVRVHLDMPQQPGEDIALVVSLREDAAGRQVTRVRASDPES